MEVNALHIKTKKRVFLMIPLLLLAFISHSFANSMPVYWQGYPSFEVLTVDKNSPVEIIHEDLVFDISEFRKHEYTISGRVSATYEMFNPTDKDLSVLMAFPIISKLYKFSKDDVSITAEGENIPFEVYLCESVDKYGAAVEQEDISFDFSKVAQAITTGPYRGENFSENDEGFMYTFEVAPKNTETINFSVRMNEFDMSRTKIAVDGFNSIEGGQDYMKVSGRCYEKTTFEIFVIGDDIDFQVEGYTDRNPEEKSDEFTYTVYRTSMSVKVFIENMIEKSKKEDTEYSDIFSTKIADIGRTQIYRMYISAMDVALSENTFVSYGDLAGQFYDNRLIILLYTVEFPANSGKTVSVRYNSHGTMDSRNTREPLYTFTYLLAPARYWAAFNNLDVEIITPSQAPYIVQSSMELKNTKPRHYTAKFTSLPENNLTFTIHANDRIITEKNRINNYFVYLSNPLVMAILMLILFAFAAAAVRSISKFKK